jgi:hypothetical protein
MEHERLEMTLPSKLSSLHADDKSHYHSALDHWFYVLGVNLIPAITRNKNYHKDLTYKQWLTEEQSKEDYERLKTEGMYDDGVALVPYKIWRGQHSGKYLLFIDCDNQLAIRELDTVLGKIMNKQYSGINDLAQDFVVEQHTDDSNKAHVYIIVEKAVADKNSTKSVQVALTPKLQTNEIPSLEIRCNGKGTAFCFPSIHKAGHIYEILGAKIPKTLDSIQAIQLQTLLNQMLKGYGIGYLEYAGNNDAICSKGIASTSGLIPINELEEDDTIIYEGSNRHLQLERISSSKLKKFAGKKSYSDIMTMIQTWNQKHCKPALSSGDLESAAKQALGFVVNSNHLSSSNGDKSDKQNDDTKTDKKYTRSTSTSNRKQALRHAKCNKYSGEGGGTDTNLLAEAVLFKGQPKYLQITPGESYKMILKDQIDLTEQQGIILDPPNKISSPFLPYSFESEEEISFFINRAKSISLEGLFTHIKTLFEKYVDTDEHEQIVLLTAYTIFSYFADKFGILPYLFLVGDTGSGKNQIYLLFAQIGYRVIAGTDISYANLLEYLGFVEECQACVVEDEIDDLEKSSIKMKLAKEGYSTGGKSPKILDGSSKDRDQIEYLLYCPKIYAAESLPRQKDAKGFLERCFIIKCLKGDTGINIKNIIKCANPKFRNEAYGRLYDELMYIHKLLLVYRMLHFDEPVPEVKLNLNGRELELCESLVRLFQNTPKVCKILLEALSKFIRDKRTIKSNTLEYRLFDIIKTDFCPIDVDTDKDEWTVKTEDIFLKAKESMHGDYDVKNPKMAFITDELSEDSDDGRVTKSRVTRILKEKFKATDTWIHETSNLGIMKTHRGLCFSRKSIRRTAMQYDVPQEIKIISTKNMKGDSSTVARFFNHIEKSETIR